jgi:SAM-dependent methyltransferase
MPVVEQGWWEEERAAFIRDRVRARIAPGVIVADVGCGRGRLLGAAGLDAFVVNVDSHHWDDWRPAPDVAYVRASATALPFRDGAFDVVGSFDVLEHLVDDVASLSEQRRVVSDGGTVVAAVPADTRLWSAHDDAVGHLRRYDPATISRAAASAGLESRDVTHFFSYLWLPALLTRRRRARTAEPGNGDGLGSRVVRHVVAVVAALERRVLRRWRLPVGTSVWFESVPTVR